MAVNLAAANDIAANVDAANKAESDPATDLQQHVHENRPQGATNGIDSKAEAQRRYKEERDRRVRTDGLAQYMDPASSAIHSRFAEDPWTDPLDPNLGVPLPDGSHHKILIVGAGFGGILYAIHLLKAGFKLDDLRIIDSAAGFGGTWYWNRYPGLMCDTESSIYLPLLEETGYIPKSRYESGQDIKNYVDLIVDKYKLHKVASFRVQIKEMCWDEDAKEWQAVLSQKLARGQQDRPLKVSATFVCLATGVLNYPKLPNIPGIEEFQGSSFHTARWDYTVTGGSPTNPNLNRLAGKKVAIVGTGATGIQAVPALAKDVEQLYVIQRTPSAVDWRGNHPISGAEFQKTIATHPGWQLERQLNFCAFVNKNDPPPAKNLVNDAWTTFPSYSAVLGTPATKYNGTAASLSAHLDEMHALDLTRQNRIRARVDEFVTNNPATAAKLKPWYAGWCKRPCFHDGYLPTFNSPHVTLLDTSSTPIERATPAGLIVAGQEYPIDIIVWSTGFNAAGMGDPSQRAAMKITGRDGRTMREIWARSPNTLHGVVAGNFPNLFFPGPLQAAGGVNFTFVIEQLAMHCAYMMAEACRRAERPVVEPTPGAVEEWGLRMARGAGIFAALVGCTPGYINREGEIEMKELSPEEQAEQAKGGSWTAGLESFLEFLEEWRKEGEMVGVEVRGV